MTLKNPQEQMLIPKDTGFYEMLYRDYYEILVRFAEGILFDEEEARDIVQEVFLDLWNKDKNILINSSIKTYLYSCVKYKTFNRIKKLKLIDKHQDQVKEAILYAMDYSSLPEDELKEKFHSIFEEFSPQMRKVVELHSFSGLKYKEIAEELNISANTVKTYMKRAYKRLKMELSKEMLTSVLVWHALNKFL
ncbi:RNA polymerase sigma-70 factor [Labilibaculum antarcticum]|uniref:RNA polymerase sigma-70 factor n=1 Tax=Labilibaculum antarcticum TaxID=1717717 RepID=A0A1Y1CFZ0_9BACT|nr:RNA polymerase sigma-70 factor [Labilibaculum antarcticum]BAX79296.1 RNA polymerase sigma-70 factor [Labilibaculum antarcticum]